MREHKFKAWDIEAELWRFFTINDLANGRLSKFRLQWFCEFTGFYDEGGCEAYEGDIVEYEFDPMGLQTGEFIFDEGTFFLKGTGRWRPKHFKVIGDIYNNSELLK